MRLGKEILVSLTLVLAAPEHALAKAPLAEKEESTPSRLRLGVFGGFPDFRAGTMIWEINQKFGLQMVYAPVMPIEIDLEVPSKSLVEQDGFSIRSPNIMLPFTIDFGSSWTAAGNWHPWSGSFYLSAGWTHRTIRIQSRVESPLIFENGDEQVTSNTRLAAELATLTEQDFLRAAIGQRWDYRSVYWGWTLGAENPLQSKSIVTSRVRILNPNASNSEDKPADNLEIARDAQESAIKGRVEEYLRSYEHLTLPLFGLEIGFVF